MQVFRLSLVSIYESVNGKVINIMADDVNQFGLMFEYIQHTWKGPFESAIFAYFIYREIGLAGIVGCSLLLCFMPLQG